MAGEMEIDFLAAELEGVPFSFRVSDRIWYCSLLILRLWMTFRTYRSTPSPDMNVSWVMPRRLV